jgi:hypothetical protein
MEPVLRVLAPYVDESYLLPLHGHAGGSTDGPPAARGAVGRIGRQREPLPCWSLFTQAHITSDGRLSACCWDPSETFTMGDLSRVRFLEAWNSEPFQRLRAAHLARDVRGTVCEACIEGAGVPR